MARFLILVLVVVGVIWWIKSSRRRKDLRQSSRDATPPSPPRPLPMVVCAACGTHTPKAEAIERDGQWYCCLAHLPQDRS